MGMTVILRQLTIEVIAGLLSLTASSSNDRKAVKVRTGAHAVMSQICVELYD